MATIEMHLTDSDNLWVLEGKVLDTTGQLLWEGKVEDKNLSEATCQITHQIFGNTRISNKEGGDPYRGITLLLEGNKANAATPAAVKAKDRSKLGKDYYILLAVENLFRYALPTILIILALLVGIVGVQDIYSNNGLYGILLLISAAISVGISRYFFELRIRVLNAHIYR